MSGAGRKHRAKHLTEQYLDINGWSGPANGQHLAICLEAPHGQHVRVLQLGDTDETNVQEFVLFPRRFHKVIWLRVMDVIVVQDGGLDLKPSPEQMEMFLNEHAEWRERVEKAKEIAAGLTRTIERQPLFQQSKETTTSVLPAPGESGDVVEHDPLAALGNPNRQNIRHRQQYFFGVEPEDDDDEEDEGEEEEGAKEDEEEPGKEERNQ